MTYAELEGSPKAVFDHPDQPGPQPTKVEKKEIAFCFLLTSCAVNTCA